MIKPKNLMMDLNLTKIAMEHKLQFAFIGTNDQFIFFISQILQSVPEVDLTIKDKRPCEQGNEFIVEVQDDAEMAFRIGYIYGAVLAKYNRFEGTQFESTNSTN